MALKTKVHFENLDIDRQNRKTNSTHVIASTSWKHFVPRNLFGGLEQRDGQMHARWYCNMLTAGQATYSTLTSPPVSPRLRETSTEQLTPSISFWTFRIRQLNLYWDSHLAPACWTKQRQDDKV